MLPRNLKYGTKSEAQSAKAYLSNITPNGQLGGYNPGSVCKILIPTDPNIALCTPESVLKFKVKIQGENGVGRLDSAGAHSFIQRIKIFAGSNVLEEIDNYNLFAKEMINLQMSKDSMMRHNVTGGMKPTSLTKSDITTADATNEATASALANSIKTTLNAGVNTDYINNGDYLKANGGDTEDNNHYTFAITLMSILGSFSNVYFPLFKLSTPVRLEITFASSIHGTGAFNANATGFQINDVEYLASYLKLSDSAMASLNSSLDNGMVSYSTLGVKNSNYTFALGNSQTQVNFMIDAKHASVKSILVSMRDTNKIDVANYYPLSTHHFNTEKYYFKIGSNSSTPSIPPNTKEQMFNELMKSTGSFAEVSHCSLINRKTYNDAIRPVENTATTLLNGSVSSGNFLIGIDTESYCSSDKSSIYTGTQLTTSDVTCVINHKAQGGDNEVTARYDAFVMFDKELVFMNGTAYASD